MLTSAFVMAGIIMFQYGPSIVVYAVAQRGEHAGYMQMRQRGYSREIIGTSKDDLIDVYYLR